MITKGIIEKIINPYSVKVRIPIFDATKEAKEGVKTDELSNAIICALPNSGNLLEVNDVVFVAFEDNDIAKPIIIGHLYKEVKTNTKIDLELNNLKTFSTTKLNKDTYIGEVKPSELKALLGVRENIQNQIDNLNDLIEELRGMI